MPQPRKPSASSGTRRNGARSGGGSKATPKPAPADKLEERLHEAAVDGPTAEAPAARVLSPRDLIVLTRERIQAVVDDAVERGRMTRADGASLVGELLSLGRRQTEDMLADIEQLLGRSRDQLTGTQERLLREVDKATKRMVGGGSLPIAGYDELTAAQVTDRVGELTPAELRKLRDYERRNANRKSVLDAIEAALA